jgi:hypothetical protein
VISNGDPADKGVKVGVSIVVAAGVIARDAVVELALKLLSPEYFALIESVPPGSCTVKSSKYP